MRVTANVLRMIVENEDARSCVAAAEEMRSWGMRYNDIFDAVHAATGIDNPEWDELLRVGES